MNRTDYTEGFSERGSLVLVYEIRCSFWVIKTANIFKYFKAKLCLVLWKKKNSEIFKNYLLSSGIPLEVNISNLLENKGIETYIPDGSEKEYNVKDLLGTVYIEIKSEKEILQLLRKLKSESDTEETLLQKASDAGIMLQPNIMGIGVDLNKVDLKKLKGLIKKLFNKE